MFNLRRETLGHTTVLHCSGRIVFPDADALHSAVLQLPRSRKLVLDLADVIPTRSMQLDWASSCRCTTGLRGPEPS